MLKHLVLWLVFVGGLVASARENLIFNGDFSRLEAGMPQAWVSNPFAEFHTDGGPGNKPFVRMIPGNLGAYENKFRQYDLTMVAGAKYRMSAWIRTTEFQSPNAAILLTNEGWFAAEGLKGFPKNTDWKHIETVIVCPESKHSHTYGFVCLAVGHTGFLDIADIRLEALDEETEKKSAPTWAVQMRQAPRLVPWGGNLNAIPLHAPELPFVWFGSAGTDFIPQNHALTVSDAAAGFVSSPVGIAPDEAVFKVSLLGLKAGWHKLTCTVAETDSGKTVFSMPLWVRLKDMPRPEEVTRPRRLNNFACDYFNGNVTAGQTVDVVLDRERWFFIAMKDAVGNVMVDGQTVNTKTSPRGECFCFLEAGRHAVVPEASGKLIVRSIAETLGSAMLEGPRMETFPKYDWEFTKKWASNAITSYNRGNPTEKELQECRSWGAAWIGQLYAVGLSSTEDALGRLNKVIGTLTLDGVTADEFGYTDNSLEYWTQALKTFDLKRDRRIYTWCGLEPLNRAVHSDFIATCANASMGHGKILSEVYLKSFPTEAEAMDSIRKELVEPFRKTCQFYPDLAYRSGIILGNFNQIGVITLEHQAEVDYKAFLDAQLHTLATDPVFQNLGTTGYWGYHYTDEEMFRWSSRLLRHYVIEGRRDRLSEQYGFTYLPGHIRNNEFEDGLKGWTVSAAEPGTVSVGFNDTIAVNIQDRWHLTHNTRGNTFCQFHKVPGKASTVSQRVTGLEIGRMYMLLYCTADLDDINAKRLNPRKLGIEAELDNVLIFDSMSWIDQRVYGNYSTNHKVARMNVNRVIFMAQGNESRLTFSDEQAKDGENLILNYIQLKPFYPLEE